MRPACVHLIKPMQYIYACARHLFKPLRVSTLLAAMAAHRRSRRPLVLLKRKVVGVDAKGWQWVAVWKKGGGPRKIGRCLTDVSLTKTKDGKTMQKSPHELVGKSGEGRCQLRCPRGLPGPAGAPGGGWARNNKTRQPLRSRFIAWQFCRRPPGCALQNISRERVRAGNGSSPYLSRSKCAK